MFNEKIREVALEAIKNAGKMALEKYNNFDRDKIKMKSKSEIVTEVDILSEEIIIQKIKENFPEHGIVAEESGEKKIDADYKWIIDPIDGTTNFSMHNPMWCISIGLAFKNKIIYGIIFAPYLNELYEAVLGKGATMNGKKIQVSDICKGKILTTFCHGSSMEDKKKAVKYYSNQKLNNGFTCRQMGSAALELAYVAAGRIESIMIPGANSWDIAAGVLLVREAGGKVSDFEGIEWNLESKGILASNKVMHEKFVCVLKDLEL